MPNDPIKKLQTFDADKWISKSEAARLRGISRQAIWELVRRGRLAPVVYERRMYLNRAEVLNFQRRPRGPNLPKPAYFKTKKFNSAKWITKVEAGYLAGVTTQVISDLVRRRRLRTMEGIGKTLIQRSSLDKFLEQQQKSNPTKLKSKTKPAKKK
jgi:hypothetical protein